MKKVTLELEDGQDFRREFISRKSLYQCIRAQNEGSIGVRRVRPYEAFAAAQRLRVMETLARMAVFTVLISGVSLVHARADGTSVYIAGKAKYCKETAVSGYLDCFYANLDACEKHNKSTNLRCVANPNSGT